MGDDKGGNDGWYRRRNEGGGIGNQYGRYGQLYPVHGLAGDCLNVFGWRSLWSVTGYNVTETRACK